jgi:hypothetical protein
MRALQPNFHSHEYGGVDAPPRLLLRPAYIMLPFIRAPVGFEHVRPMSVIMMTGWLILGPGILEFIYVGFTRAKLPDDLGYIYLFYFALAYCALALAVFVRRAIGQRWREEIHTAEAGYSWLAWMTPLPVWLCEIVLVPAAVGVAGYFIQHSAFSYELGWWLMLTALSLMLMAVWESKRRWSQHRATVDDVIRAKTFEARVSGHEAQGQGGAVPGADAAGKPDIAELGASPKRRK